MGWNTVESSESSRLFRGLEGQSFYFVHSYAVKTWTMPHTDPYQAPALVTTCNYGEEFIAAVENGPLSAVQFHPEKSGESGLTLLENWVSSL